MSGGMFLYAEDDVGALVFDVGHNSTRAGYGGEAGPKYDVPSTVGLWLDYNDEVTQKRYNIGDNAISVRRPEMELTSFLKDGMIEDWDTFENFMDYMYTNMLRVVPKDHPILVTEPPWNTAEKREHITELMFEKYSVPAFYLAKNASLVAFANGLSTCLVVDSGATHTSAVPVHDGFVLPQFVVKSPAGGDYISIQCRNYLTEKGIEIVPPCLVASKNVRRSAAAPKFKRRSLQAPLTESWHNYMIKQVMQDFQASVLQVSNNLYDEQVVKTMPPVHYEFPNGFHRDFGVERFKIPEPLFNPAAGFTSGIHPTLGIGSLVTTCAEMCSVDIIPTLYSGVVVTGGNTNLLGFPERLKWDLAARTPSSIRPKIISSPGATARKFEAWTGGSILTSHGSFQQMWICKREYEDNGVAVLQSKCL